MWKEKLNEFSNFGIEKDLWILNLFKNELISAF